MQTSQVLHHALEMGGRKLLFKYKSAFKNVLKEIRFGFLPQFEKFTESMDGDGLIDEVENKQEYVEYEEGEVPDFENTGIVIVKYQNQLLAKLCDELLT